MPVNHNKDSLMAVIHSGGGKLGPNDYVKPTLDGHAVNLPHFTDGSNIKSARFSVEPLCYEEALDEVMASIREELLRKHHDYGSSNLMRRGELGIVVRCEDKLARVENLLGHEPQVGDESRQKTWLDISGYAIQAMLMGLNRLELPVRSI